MPETSGSVVHVVLDPAELRAAPAAYQARLAALVRDSRAPWIAWSGALFPGGPRRPANIALTAALGGVAPSTLCLAKCERGDVREPSWLAHFSSGLCVPWLWRRHALLDLLDNPQALLPTPFYLPFQLALAMPPTAIAQTHLHGPARSRPPAAALRARGAALPHILPILAASALPSGALSLLAQPPAISIVLCAYNEEERIAWAIASVLAQSDDSWELLVVDDGSDDGTLATARLLTHREPRVRLLRQPVNVGKAHALNQALADARGGFFLELDADDWLPPHAIRSMCDAIAGTDSGVSLLTFDHFVWRRARSGELLPRGIVPASAPLVTRRAARVPIPRLFRTSALRELGGWRTSDTSGGRLFEDVAITREVQHRSVVARHSGVLYHRVIRQSSVSQSHRRAYESWARSQFPEM